MVRRSRPSCNAAREVRDSWTLVPLWAPRPGDVQGFMRTIPLILGVIALLGPALASAQIPGPETYAGDFWTRPRLTGDWGGFRDQMSKRGVTLDVDWLQTFQGVMTGGKAQDSGYWGLAEYTLRFDSQKLGLWPGAFLNISAMSSYGATAIRDTGA